MPSTKTIDQESIDTDQEMADLLSSLKGDMTVNPLAEVGDKKGADVLVECYHAFDGRAQKFPAYMVTGEGGAMSVLKYRFTADQVTAAGADPKWIGKQVWHTKPQPSELPQGRVMCRFHVNQTPEQKAAVEAQGLNLFCRHKTSFLTAAAEDKHARLRHRNYYGYQNTRNASEDRQATQAQTALLLALAERLTATTPAEEPPKGK